MTLYVILRTVKFDIFVAGNLTLITETEEIIGRNGITKMEA